MSPHTVIRRFEIHGDANALDGIPAALSGFTKVPRDELKAEITRHPRTSMMSVRLTGTPTMVARLRKTLSDQRVAVLRDWLELVPPTLVDQYPDLRALLRIDPDEISRTVRGKGEPVVVAVVDSGLSVDLREFENHAWTTFGTRSVYGARFADGKWQDWDVTDQDGHGTMLAGTILATAHVDEIKIMALKFYDVVTQPAAANAAAALRFAAAAKPAIINLSFDLGIGSADLRAAFRTACHDTDALIVIAAGNTGSDNDAYPLVPACYADECRERVIVIMATDLYDERPTFSNFGATSVDFAAPGVAVMSTRPRVSRGAAATRYGRYTGTSAAAAHVAGAAALLKAHSPGLTGAQLKKLLVASLEDLPRLRCRHPGRLDLGAALRLLNRATPPAAGALPGGRGASGP